MFTTILLVLIFLMLVLIVALSIVVADQRSELRGAHGALERLMRAHYYQHQDDIL